MLHVNASEGNSPVNTDSFSAETTYMLSKYRACVTRYEGVQTATQRQKYLEGMCERRVSYIKRSTRDVA